MRLTASWLAVPIVLVAGAAQAGDAVLYAPPPAWVEAYKGTISPDGTSPIVLYDVQQRIENGTQTSFVDQAILLNSPQALTQAGTSSATWLPDKGDLTVSRVQIIRGGETIDVLATGAKYTVIRRESNLERRMLDGTLTATLAVPGLRLGDILRVSYTVSLTDPTLAGHAQLLTPLISAPLSVGFARQRISWPATEAVRWRAGPAVDGVVENTTGRDKSITLTLPLPKRDDLPDDAPLRFTRPPTLQAGTFASWQQVSSLFTPLYATTGTIAPGSPLAGEVDRIKAAGADPLERAALATRLVQDKVSYMLNGMNSGNYTPAAPEQTWETRYGDCKAKTLLLLALLDGLGIKAEPVLANLVISDATPDMLPMPGVFDHVLVRAEIGDKTYWLDGTGAGTRLDSIADTPNLRHVLPVRAAGADLLAVEPRVPVQAMSTLDLLLDERGGVDLPTLVTMKARMAGALGSSVGGVVKQANDEQKKQMIDAFAASALSNVLLTSGEFSYDEDTGITEAAVTGILTTSWSDEGARKRRNLNELPSANFLFSPDRARSKWRAIPVELGYPNRQGITLRLLLPEDGTGYELLGKADIDLSAAGQHVVRHAVLSGGELQVSEQLETMGGELPASQVAAEKGQAARIANATSFLLSPPGAARAWEYGRAELKDRLGPYEKAYALAIARAPDDANSYLNRARFRNGVTEFRAALADYDKSIELDPDPDNYTGRAGVWWSLGDIGRATADYRQAYDLSPSSDTAIALASAMGAAGHTDDALALLDEFDGRGDQHTNVVQARADVLAQGGRAEEGLVLLSGLIAEQPGQGALFNTSCWYRARFRVGLNDMMSVCNDAVERAGMAASALDSRALAWVQLGDLAQAKKDAESALTLDPDLFTTRYILAYAERALGDRSANTFVQYFSKTWPGLAHQYASYGLKP